MDVLSRDPTQPNRPEEVPNNRYSKHKGYETVRFPQSGLVGTCTDRTQMEIWNKRFKDHAERNRILNGNVANWLNSKINIKHQTAKVFLTLVRS